MKKIKLIIFITLLLFCMTNCYKDNQDDSYLYDQDENCVFGSLGTCCDIDGRILVEQNSVYTYTSSYNSDFLNIEWEILSGDITLVSSQNTTEATFRFGKNFTTGKIISKTYSNSGYCEDIIEISKL